mgnify:CR=1 FL=1
MTARGEENEPNDGKRKYTIFYVSVLKKCSLITKWHFFLIFASDSHENSKFRILSMVTFLMLYYLIAIKKLQFLFDLLISKSECRNRKVGKKNYFTNELLSAELLHNLYIKIFVSSLSNCASKFLYVFGLYFLEFQYVLLIKF